MKEKKDAVLAHVYMFDYNAERPRSSIRGRMQVSALSHLYAAGLVDKIFIAGGKVWGQDYPSLAGLMAGELVRKSVDPRDIILRPEALETGQEVDLFLEEARRRGWDSLGGIANKTHLRRIDKIYKRRGQQIEYVSAEEVLGNISQDHSLRPNPYRDFLSRFEVSEIERKFRRREKLVNILYILGLEKILRRIAQSRRVQKFKVPFDS